MKVEFDIFDLPDVGGHGEIEAGLRFRAVGPVVRRRAGLRRMVPRFLRGVIPVFETGSFLKKKYRFPGYRLENWAECL